MCRPASPSFPGPRVNWGYRTVPQKHLNNRDMWYPQGKTLGGGSLDQRAMIYTRGHRIGL